MATESPLRQLVELHLGMPVAPWIRARRPHTSWRALAEELRKATNGRITVPHQTLMNWAPDTCTPPEGIPVTPKAAS